MAGARQADYATVPRQGVAAQPPTKSEHTVKSPHTKKPTSSNQTDAYKKAADVVIRVNRRVLERLKDK